MSLSLAGRITLCSLILATTPFYSMQTAWLPQSIYDRIDGVCRNFLWGTTKWNRKLHQCKCEVVWHPKWFGGLGLHHDEFSNLAFMSKLGWGLIHHREELWVKVLRSQYGYREDLLPYIALKIRLFKCLESYLWGLDICAR